MKYGNFGGIETNISIFFSPKLERVIPLGTDGNKINSKVNRNKVSGVIKVSECPNLVIEVRIRKFLFDLFGEVASQVP